MKCGAIFGSPFVCYLSEGSDPILCVVCATVGGGVFALDANSGSMLMRYELGDQLFGSLVVTRDGVFVPCRDDHLYCLL